MRIRTTARYNCTMSDTEGSSPLAKKQKLATSDEITLAGPDDSDETGFLPAVNVDGDEQPAIKSAGKNEVYPVGTFSVSEGEDAMESSAGVCRSHASVDVQPESIKPSSSTNVSEVDVGITEYISKHFLVSAIIKQRYSDFIVNEISSSGETVSLTSIDLPSEEPEEKVTCGPADALIANKLHDKLTHLAASTDKTETVVIPAGEDKQTRQNIHKAVKAAFPMLETRTDISDDQKVIIISHKKSGGRDSRQKSCREWPASKSKLPYCRFVLYKENKDTMDVIGLIAKYLKVKEGLFQYAGTKDRRAKTSQEITAYKVHPKKLCGLNDVLRNIKLGNFRYVDKPLKLGELKGNYFAIVLRNVLGSEEELQKGLNSLKSTGFINYFGMQRFGTTSVPTHEIGRVLLKGDWEEAVNLILCPRTSDGSNEQFRQTWAQTRDPAKTLEVTDKRFNIERSILRALQKGPKNFYGALQALPRNTRMMYVHSYQSLVWNTVVSRRIQSYGLQLVPGDLVLPVCPHLSLEGEESQKVPPVILKEQDLSQYSIYNVVLPLPGHDVVYPANEVKNWYEAHLSQDGLDINNLHRKHKDYSLPGAYRAMVVKPSDMEWQTFCYNDYTIPLILSDLDRLEKKPKPASCPGGKLRALSLSFALPSSCYATMALRELLKVDTSPSHQITLNVS